MTSYRDPPQSSSPDHRTHSCRPTALMRPLEMLETLPSTGKRCLSLQHLHDVLTRLRSSQLPLSRLHVPLRLLPAPRRLVAGTDPLRRWLFESLRAGTHTVRPRESPLNPDSRRILTDIPPSPRCYAFGVQKYRFFRRGLGLEIPYLKECTLSTAHSGSFVLPKLFRGATREPDRRLVPVPDLPSVAGNEL